MSAEAREPPRNARAGQSRRFPAGGPSKADAERLRTKLMEMRIELLKSSQGLAAEGLKGSGQDFSVDHLADHGSDNFAQDFTLSLLEEETERLQAIHAALRKIEGVGDLPFGICEQCAESEGGWEPEGSAPWIPLGRLEVLPYATLCVAHQEEQEES